MATATTYGARAHARAQEGSRTEAMPVVPAGAWPAPPCEAGHLVWAETVAGGNYTHKVLARGTELRLTDLRGDACAHLLLYAADRPWERLNVADTVKVQWNAYLGEGSCSSDQGRVLASWSPTPPAATTRSAAPPPSYATPSATATEPRSPPPRRPRTVQAGRRQERPRTPRPAPSLSFFQGVEVRDDGSLDFTGPAGPGGSVTLRAEQDVTVLLANVPHPADPRTEYVSTPWRSSPGARPRPRPATRCGRPHPRAVAPS